MGFCNTGCRNDFAVNMQELPRDRQYFDKLIKEQDLASSPAQTTKK
jgi:hypothetical protein